MTKEEIIKIAREYSIKGGKQLAEELNYSVHAIFKVVDALRRKGIKIERPKKISALQEAIEELKKITL